MKTKLNVSLSDLIQWARDNDMDTSDMSAVREAYKREKEGKADKEERAYTKKHVTLYIHLPNGDTLHFFDLPNRKSQLLTKAYTEAVNAIAEAYKGKRGVNQKDLLGKVTVSWGESFNLVTELESTTM